MIHNANDKDILSFIESISYLHGIEFTERAVCFASTFFPPGCYTRGDIIAKLYELSNRDEFSEISEKMLVSMDR